MCAVVVCVCIVFYSLEDSLELNNRTYLPFQNRGNDILGLNTEKSDIDGLPYTTLSYANGIGYYHTINADGSRINLSVYNYSNPFHRYPATVPLLSETHGGEDVGINFFLFFFIFLFVGIYFSLGWHLCIRT